MLIIVIVVSPGKGHPKFMIGHPVSWLRSLMDQRLMLRHCGGQAWRACSWQQWTCGMLAVVCSTTCHAGPLHHSYIQDICTVQVRLKYTCSANSQQHPTTTIIKAKIDWHWSTDNTISQSCKFRFSSLFLPYCGQVMTTSGNQRNRWNPPPNPKSLVTFSHTLAGIQTWEMLIKTQTITPLHITSKSTLYSLITNI